MTAAQELPRCVLVVEDDPSIRSMIRDELEDHGYRVELASHGEEARERLGQVHPDAIVLDLMLPLLHGWDFMERYQERANGRRIPIIVVSAARALPSSFDQYGVRAILGKPFDLQELASQVAAVTHEPPQATEMSS